MSREKTIEFTVPFYHTDAMQVVWHGNYLKYFETARATLFAEAGVDLYHYYGESGYLFPVTRTATKHIHPLRYNDQCTCTARLTECKHKLVVEFEVRLVADGTLCARGRTEQVAIRGSDFGLELLIPETIRARLEDS
jgi:acyl-CoA thioester hydrolase